jgi:FKBP-type peptidyl-prolyl cis-trans isomerase
MRSTANALFALVILPLAFASSTRAADPKTEDEKTLYALGLAISGNLQGFGLSAAELEIVKAGITDGVTGKPEKVKLDTYGPKIQELAKARASKVAEAEKKKGQTFLDAEAKKPGASKKPSGLIYFETKAGTGAQPKASDTVKVHYKGTLIDGKVFDSSIDRGEPAEFPLGNVVPCWTEGVALMKVGGKARLVCPSSIAYGERGAPPDIKPGATLVFEVELLEVKAGVPAATPGLPAGAGKPAGHP